MTSLGGQVLDKISRGDHPGLGCALNGIHCVFVRERGLYLEECLVNTEAHVGVKLLQGKELEEARYGYHLELSEGVCGLASTLILDFLPGDLGERERE